ncbi:hypothetical protein M0638_18400 [Roseomonas sp. NAR14]|uniref:Uncharacterized protein n=1 Tax=Roseomonas acroporae TaxID=2937791 RepID=A0A9X1YAW9_9PROT|nr:hypothetical protein [Roseomonas acroporae]MCK8786352.1 hypothetical protein [Roseomonas acroporae]
MNGPRPVDCPPGRPQAAISPGRHPAAPSPGRPPAATRRGLLAAPLLALADPARAAEPGAPGIAAPGIAASGIAAPGIAGSRPAAAGLDWPSFDWPGFAAGWLAPIRAAAAALDGPGLLRSWVTAGEGDFDRVQREAAYTYDNALAGLALLAAGEDALALRLAEGLRLAQTQDRFWHDGRLRNAYAAGRQHAAAPASARPPGWWDAAAGRWAEDRYQVGSAAGPTAFAGLLWLRCAERGLGRPADWRAAADRAADWLETLRVPDASGGFRGGTLGHEPAPEPLPWRSTEQNLDLAALFARLGRPGPAAEARRFVAAAWRPAEGRFLSGLLPDGTPNPHSALDANLWPLLAFPGEAAWRPALAWVLSRHGVPAGAPATALDGLDFDDDRDGAWWEGTAQAVLVLRRARWMPAAGAVAARLAAAILRQRDPRGWLLAASLPWLTTGLGTGLVPGVADFRYPRRGHLGATAWAALAGLDADPFTANRSSL